jgi:hydrogenase maturation protease
MPRVLIVAYGNPLRSDDGVAWRAAHALEGKFSASEVEILRLHQLAPELAEQASRSQYILFIDAASVPSSVPGEIRVEEIRSENDRNHETRFTHVLSPQAVLALAASLYHAKPRALLVTVTGENFDHGDDLSSPVSAALPVLADRIEALVQAFLRQKT